MNYVRDQLKSLFPAPATLPFISLCLKLNFVIHKIKKTHVGEINGRFYIQGCPENI